MKTILQISITLILLTGCSQRLGDYYFDFDEIDHYSIEIEEDDIFNNLDASNLSEIEVLQNDLLISNTPKSVTDTLFLKNIDKTNYSKNDVSQEELSLINDIFREKSHKNPSWFACIAVYRDILIFRKQGKIVGISKICFHCSQNEIFGTNSNTDEFGQSGDYGQLEEILKK
jgi:hypothetical protein